MTFRRCLRTFCILLIAVFSFSVQYTAADSASRFSMYRSEDNGRTWSRSETGLPGATRINVIAATGQAFMAGTDAGIYVSVDSGKSWKPSTNKKRVTSMAVLNNRVFAGASEGGLLSSSDDGQNWEPISSFPRRIARSLKVHEGMLHVGTDSDAVYSTQDGGRTWTHRAAGLPENAQVLAFTSIGSSLYAGLYAKGLYSWSSQEQKWLPVGSTDRSPVKPLALASVGTTLIAGNNPGGLYSSDDLGQTWKHWSLAPASTPFEDSTCPFSNLDSIPNNSFAPFLQAPIWEMASNSTLAIAGAANGIYYSDDRGRTWIRATAGLPSTSPGVAFLVQDGLILAATHDKSADCQASSH